MAVSEKKKEPIVVIAVVEFQVDSDEVDETELISGLQNECVKVKSGIYENCFYGDIASASIVQDGDSERLTALTEGFIAAVKALE